MQGIDVFNKMKVYTIFLLFLFPFFNAHGQSITLDETRSLYVKSTRDKEVCEELYKRLSTLKTDDNYILSGYYGAVAANLANQVKEPAQKIKLFNQGRRLIEKAIQMDSLNLELHFLRFTIQSNCPRSLNYNRELEPDKTFIIKHLGQSRDVRLQKKIATFMASSKSISEEEKLKFKKFLD